MEPAPVKDDAIAKLKLLVTVVDRQKAEFYLDVLSQFDVNFQLVTGGKGTASSELVELLGLNTQKSVIFSVTREDRVDEILNCLEEKFETIRKGKGVAFAIPLTSVIGVRSYQFLGNNRFGREAKE